MANLHDRIGLSNPQHAMKSRFLGAEGRDYSPAFFIFRA